MKLHALVIVCTRAMAIMKTRLAGAQKGYSLLKKKSDALTSRFRSILKKIIEVGHTQSCVMRKTKTAVRYASLNLKPSIHYGYNLIVLDVFFSIHRVAFLAL